MRLLGLLAIVSLLLVSGCVNTAARTASAFLAAKSMQKNSAKTFSKRNLVAMQAGFKKASNTVITKVKVDADNLERRGRQLRALLEKYGKNTFINVKKARPSLSLKKPKASVRTR